ncbi:MAG: transglutaminase family protein, partial [Rubripirellula sp.]
LSAGGCTYFVSDPSGRGTERFPINANEAESRRATRFETLGLSSGQVEYRVPYPDHEPGNPYPVTLDLRRV